jgi:hypothetical protein
LWEKQIRDGIAKLEACILHHMIERDGWTPQDECYQAVVAAVVRDVLALIRLDYTQPVSTPPVSEPTERMEMLDDIGSLLEALGKPNVARPDSPQAVMRECVAAVREEREKRDRLVAAARIAIDVCKSRGCGAFEMEHDLEAALALWPTEAK